MYLYWEYSWIHMRDWAIAAPYTDEITTLAVMVGFAILFLLNPPSLQDLESIFLWQAA